MASASKRLQPCSKCPKSQGHVSCGGCEQWFCITHLLEHRQDLADQLEGCVLERDQLQENLLADDNVRRCHLMTCVDRWEAKSIERIQQVAEKVRSQLRNSLSRSKRHIDEALRPITADLEEKKQTKDYTEMELTRWTSQLKVLKEQLENAPMVEMAQDADERPSYIIPLIQLRSIEGTKGKAEIYG